MTITGCCGAGSDLAGSECSVCGSRARHVIVQLHFLHFTTHAVDNPEGTPCMGVYYRRTKGEYHPEATASVFIPDRSLFSIAPPVGCLDIVRMIVSPGSSHPFRLFMVWHDIVVIRKFFVADWANPVLLDNLPVEQFPHLGK